MIARQKEQLWLVNNFKDSSSSLSGYFDYILTPKEIMATK